MNRTGLKITRGFIAPLLLLLLSLLFCSAEEPATQGRGAERTATTEQVLHDSKITLLENGRTTAVIEAKYIEKRFGEKDTRAQEVTAYFYDSTGELTSWLVADSGAVNEPENKMNVWGDVLVTSRDSVKLHTQSLTWDQKVNRVVTEDYVEIHMQNGIYRGYGLVTDRSLKEFIIKRQISGRMDELPQ